MVVINALRRHSAWMASDQGAVGWVGKHSPIRCQRPQQGEGAAMWLFGAGGENSAISSEMGADLECSGSTTVLMWLE